MKYVFIFLFVLPLISFAQSKKKTDRFRATEYQTIKLDNKRVADQYSECNILIVFNYAKSKIKFYNEDQDEFDIISVGEVYENKADGKSVDIQCLDNEGLRCKVSLWTTENGLFVAVEYTDFIYMYKIIRV